MSHWSDQLVEMRACGESVEWAITQPSPEAAWATCERADWMLWILGKFAGSPESESRKPLVLCACDCAETALQYVRGKSERRLTARSLATTRAWTRGGAMIDEVRAASSDACADTSAAYAAAFAAGVTEPTTYAAATYAANAAPDRDAAFREMADIVRRHYPNPPSEVQP